MSIVLSHRTARAYHQSPFRPDAPPVLPVRRKKLNTDPVDAVAVQDARLKLARLGIPPSHLEELDVLLSSGDKRRRARGVRCHTCAVALPAGSLHSLGGGIFVADIRLTALQAARDLSFVELVEYYFQILGAYELPFDPDEDYRERPPLTTIAELKRYFDLAEGMSGVVKARRALSYAREGSRSPMETALVMMLVLPKSEGGLAIRSVVMDHEVEVSSRVAHLTSRRKFYLDAFIPKFKIDIEYHGFYHDEDERASEDDERANTLRAMGYEVIPIRRWTFFNRRAFERFASTIMRKVGITPSKLPAGFAQKQERLRQFVLRRYE